MELTIHREQTEQLKVELDSYFRTHGIIPSSKHFDCPHYSKCSEGSTEFYLAVLPHVGSNYAMEIDGKPFRILFIGKEALAEEPMSIDARTKQIEEEGQADQHNPHMAGTALALKILFDLDLDSENELLEDDHIYKYMALTNGTLCHFLSVNGTKRPAAMLNNCAEHLTNTILQLKPTIVIFQGSSYDLANFNHFGPAHYPDRNPYKKLIHLGDFKKEDQGVYQSETSGLPRFVLKLYHPAGSRSDSDTRWDSPTRKYFLENVKPALEYIRKIIIG